METQPGLYGGMLISTEEVGRETKVSVLGWGAAFSHFTLKANWEKLMRGLPPRADASGTDGGQVSWAAFHPMDSEAATRPLWMRVVAAGEWICVLPWVALLALSLLLGWSPGYWLPLACFWVAGSLVFGLIPPFKLNFLRRPHSLRVVSDALTWLIGASVLTVIWPLWDRLIS